MNFSKALEIAYKAHEGQVDKAGAAYILHSIRVANSLRTEEEKTVAILHDVDEDTTVTLDDLRNYGFSSDVIRAVDSITKRVGESYNDYLNRVAADDLAYRVKLADMWDNSDVERFGANASVEQMKSCTNYITKRNKLVTLHKKLNAC